MVSASDAGREVRTAGRRASSGRGMQILARAGLTARGVMYILIGSLAVQVAFGDSGEEADRRGALSAVAGTPGGKFILWLLAAGFAGLALWRYAEAAFGVAGPKGHEPAKRVGALGRGVFYTAVCVSIVSFVIGQGSSSSNEQSKTFTARAMEQPGGRWLVLAVGLGFLGWGIGNVVNALRRKFLEKLNRSQMGPRARRVVETLGVVGRSARGVVFGGVGVFLAYAAITFDPDKAKGLDGTLREFTKTPAGPWLLVAVALGLVTYGAYSFCEARWRKVEPG